MIPVKTMGKKSAAALNALGALVGLGLGLGASRLAMGSNRSSKAAYVALGSAGAGAALGAGLTSLYTGPKLLSA